MDVHARAGEGIRASVSIAIPPAGSSAGSWKWLILRPGNLLKAMNEMSLVSDTLSKIVPRAVRRRVGVDIVQVKLGL
jgi:hypothetical protein